MSHWSNVNIKNTLLNVFLFDLLAGKKYDENEGALNLNWKFSPIYFIIKLKRHGTPLHCMLQISAGSDESFKLRMFQTIFLFSSNK